MVKIYFSLRDLIEQKTTRESTGLLRSPSLASLMVTDKEQEKAIWILWILSFQEVVTILRLI